MFGQQNIWSQLVIRELLFIGGCYPAVMHGPHAASSPRFRNLPSLVDQKLSASF